MAAAEPARTSVTARRIEAMAARALDPSGLPGSAVTATIEEDNGQGGGECRGGGGGRDDRERNVEPEPSGAAAEKLRVSDDVERRQLQLGASTPDRQGQVGPDPGGLAERQCQGLHDLAYCLFSGTLYSIIAWRRSVSR